MRWAIEKIIDILDNVDGENYAQLIGEARAEINNFLTYGSGGANFVESQLLDKQYQIDSLNEHYKALEDFVTHLKERPIYVATMYKWGSRENHSYVLAASHDKELVCRLADEEDLDRYGKYQPEVIEIGSTINRDQAFEVIVSLPPFVSPQMKRKEDHDE